MRSNFHGYASPIWGDCKLADARDMPIDRVPQPLSGEGITVSLADTVARLERELEEWRRLAAGDYPGSVRVARPPAVQPERANLRVLPGDGQDSSRSRARLEAVATRQP